MKTRKHILVIDREPEWRNFMTRVLSEAGYVVTSHHDADTSLAEIAKRASDMVLADAAQDELIRRLAADYADVRFLVFSAAPSVSEAIRVFRRGALDYESKSFDPGPILDVIQAALEKPPTRSQRFL